MRTAGRLAVACWLALACAAGAPARGADLSELKVLYVGSERKSDYVEFLEGQVARVEARSRKAFRPEEARDFDVVLLDWPQGEETREMRTLRSPLGARADWGRPTVLLGSAGLNLAVCWKLKGGSGCTCLDPLAYDLRDHEIFERPHRIDRGRMIAIPTPKDFRDELEEPEIRVLPLVDDRETRRMPGWCTHALDFARYPDVEFFCGGVNSQTPTSAALWRQGNLLHFGFQESPSEMNENGRRLLLNAIAYISRFTEDRPIAVTPSVFAGPVARSRSTPARWLRHGELRIDSIKDVVSPETWAEIEGAGDREAMARRADELARFLHPNAEQILEVDPDLVALGVAFDDPAFFDRTLADLRSSDPAVAGRAGRLLRRYAPEGPGGADADAWTRWRDENRPYLFASDAGDYRWYVDPLAKRRGVPSAELRGPGRADR